MKIIREFYEIDDNVKTMYNEKKKGGYPMNLQQLIYFEKIAELEHYTKAADALCITQPCLSYSIAELEKELGAPLFYKKGRNIKLTQYGDIFLVHVKNALKELQDGRQEIQERISPDKGKIVLSHISSMNSKYMPFLMQHFYGDPSHTNITFEFQENPTKRIVEALKARKVDIGFGSLVEDTEFNTFPVYQENMVLIVGKGHPLACRDEITLTETEGYECIAYDQHCGIRTYIDKLFEEAGATQKIVREFEDNHMITGMVAAGLGIAVVPQMYADEHYKVKPIRIKGVETYRGLYMIWLKGAFLSPAAEHFIAFVKTLQEEAVSFL